MLYYHIFKRISCQQLIKIIIFLLLFSSCRMLNEQKNATLFRVYETENNVQKCSFVFSIDNKNKIVPIFVEFFSFATIELLEISNLGDTSNLKIRILGDYGENLYLLENKIDTNQIELDSLILKEKKEFGKLSLFIASIDNGKIFFKNKIGSFEFYDIIEIRDKIDLNYDIIVITQENDDSVLIGYSFKLVEK